MQQLYRWIMFGGLVLCAATIAITDSFTFIEGGVVFLGALAFLGGAVGALRNQE